MVRFLVVSFFLLVSFQYATGKAVDVNTARTAGYVFCKTQGLLCNASELSLVYTGSSSVSGTTISDFYVFNTGSRGFVIVSADDRVVPVLAYSTESSFASGLQPEGVEWWLGKYRQQISYVITSGSVAPANVPAQWAALASGADHAEAKTTSVVLPLLTTNWNQLPNYNYLCPFDPSAGANAVTGCVATAMAQVMKYWNWPKRGVGSNSYYAGGFGLLTANFGATAYQWDSMPNVVGNNNPAVGTLMFQAGVSVNMNYGVSASSAQVLSYGGAGINCTQNALPGYFSYKPTLLGLDRGSYTDTNWVHLLQSELDAKRPVIYTGYGDSGGHCFVADGYITYDRFHFNWGWGGYANGYFIVENLAPGNVSFNSGQGILVGIEPDSTVVEQIKETTLSKKDLIYPNPATDALNIDLATRPSMISIVDAAGRKVKSVVPATGSTVETIPLTGLVNGVYYAVLQTSSGSQSAKFVIAR